MKSSPLKLARIASTKHGSDISTGLVLLLIAMPLNLGVAIASGAPPAYGIVSGAVGSLIVGVLSGSALQISGPDAGLGVLVVDMLRNFGVQSLGVIVFLCGLMQLLTGVVRGGKWFRAISPAVLNGMLAGMGLLIVVTQFHLMLDDAAKDSGLLNLLLIPSAIIKGVFPADGSSHHLAALTGITTIAVSLCWKRFAPKSLQCVPPALPAVVVATVLVAILRLPIQFITVPSNLAESLRILTVQDVMRALFDPRMLAAAGTLAFVASAQSLITSSTIDRLSGTERTKYDRELFAQGCGNMVCGILGVLPVAGVLVRSVANVQFGAKSRWSGILHGIAMLLAVLLFPHCLEYVPVASLAAVLVLVGSTMVADIVHSVKGYQRSQLLIFYGTVAAIMATNLFTGVVIGFAFAALDLLVARLSIVKAPSAYAPPSVRSKPQMQNYEWLAQQTYHGSKRSKVLLPIKDATYAQEVVDIVINMPGANSCEYRLLAVVPSVFQQSLPYSALEAHRMLDRHEEEMANMERVLRETRDKLHGHLAGIVVETVVETGDAAEVIVNQSKKWNPAMILLTSKRPHTLLDNWRPSLSQRVFKRCDATVNIVKLSPRESSKGEPMPLNFAPQKTG